MSAVMDESVSGNLFADHKYRWQAMSDFKNNTILILSFPEQRRNQRWTTS